MSKQMDHQPTKHERRRDRREEQRRLREARMRTAKNRRIVTIVGIVAAVVLIVGISSYFLFPTLFVPKTSQASTATPTPTQTLGPVDNITCDASEHAGAGSYHIHAHLSLIINDSPVTLPANLGIADDQSCIYWLHTHDTTGVINVESPNSGTYTLGTFIHLWKQQFSQL